MRSRRGRFLLLFFSLLIALELPLLLPAVDAGVVKPFTSGVAFISAAALRALGLNVSVQGTAIVGSCFSANIQNGCNGLEATLLLVAAVLAFPASARARLKAALIGVALIQAVNLVRVLSLFLVGCYRREWFDAFHVAVWQTIVFAVTILYFLRWTRTSGPADAPQRA